MLFRSQDRDPGLGDTQAGGTKAADRLVQGLATTLPRTRLFSDDRVIGLRRSNHSKDEKQFTGPFLSSETIVINL